MSAEEKTRITVDIFGTNYKLVGRSSVSYMKMVAAHVNDQMHHLSNALPQLESSKVAVLASVNIADEYFKLHKEMELLQEEGQKNSDLEAKYEKSLQQYAELEQVNKAIQEKRFQLDQQNILLQIEIQGHQTELQAAQQQLTSVELAEQQRLQEENAELRNELELERAKFSNQQSDDQDLVHEHRKLTIEYEKLKKEYNEWIQLVMEKEDPS